MDGNQYERGEIQMEKGMAETERVQGGIRVESLVGGIMTDIDRAAVVLNVNFPLIKCIKLVRATGGQSDYG